MERDLEIVSPVLSGVTVVRKNRVVKEDFLAVKVGTQAVKNDDIRRDDQEVSR
jgi:hypothetical protein